MCLSCVRLRREEKRVCRIPDYSYVEYIVGARTEALCVDAMADGRLARPVVSYYRLNMSLLRVELRRSPPGEARLWFSVRPNLQAGGQNEGPE